MHIDQIIHPDYAIKAPEFARDCQDRLNRDGVLVLPGFIQSDALETIRQEALAKQDQAYFCTQSHSVYLTPPDPTFDDQHPANRKVTSSKGCICDDEIDAASPLRHLYNSADFQRFIARTTGEAELHPYADTLSSINVHYARRGQELGWHFDNSSFAITLLIQKPDAGSRFEYLTHLRDADRGELNYGGVGALLNGDTTPKVLDFDPGTLVLFRGRNAIHRVSPNESDVTRILAVLAYNSEADVALSESARMTFYGRLG